MNCIKKSKTKKKTDQTKQNLFSLVIKWDGIGSAARIRAENQPITLEDAIDNSKKNGVNGKEMLLAKVGGLSKS